jgi:hypothetical protein
MSGGIARGRLAEERKSWRKNHPHVRTLTFNCLYSISFLDVLPYFLFWYLLNRSIHSSLGLCGEAGDRCRWVREFDDLAVYHPWQAWGESLYLFSS